MSNRPGPKAERKARKADHAVGQRTDRDLPADGRDRRELTPPFSLTAYSVDGRRFAGRCKTRNAPMGAVCGKGLQVPYLHIDVSFGTTIGQTVDATIGKAQVRVTLISEDWIRIEPDAENEAAGFAGSSLARHKMAG
jgi:hypothetical protein